MKYFLLTFLALLLFGLPVQAQDIQVRSFKTLDNDMDAKIHHVRNDMNGKKAAIIKIETTERGFSFDVGSLGVVATEQKVGETWLYVPAGVKKITIKHPTLGVLRDYFFDTQIREGTTYALALTTANVRTVIDEDAGGQYWVLTVSPKDALVTIDDGAPEVLANGVLQKLLKYGRHTYAISAPMYEPTGGTIEMGKTKVENKVSLRPAFGYLSVTSTPESKADVYVDGNHLGSTPLVTGRLGKGKHVLRVVCPLYEPVEQPVMVPPGADTLACPVSLLPNFGTIRIEAPADVTIYINDVERGKGNWTGNLTEGLYKVEGKKPSHQTVFRSLEVRKRQEQSVKLGAPLPLYGKVQVESGNIPDVEVYVDGESVGKAPNIFQNILIGNHTVELRKEGYKAYKQSVTVEEGKLHQVDAKLSKELYGNLVVTTSPGATLSISGYSGTGNRFERSMMIGEHKVRITAGGQNFEKAVEVKSGKDNTYNFPLEGKLMIKSMPSNADVSIDGRYKGKTPVTLSVFGKHAVEVRKKGYSPATDQVEVEPMTTSTRSYSLHKYPNDLYSFWLYNASISAPYGAMIGFCKTWGWYGKFQMNASPDGALISGDETNAYQHGIYKKDGHHRLSVTTGPMLKVTDWMYLYAGVGYGDYGRIYKGTSIKNEEYIYTPVVYLCPFRTKGLEVEGGAVFKIKKFAFSAGYSSLVLPSAPKGEKNFGDVHIGIGFTFNHD